MFTQIISKEYLRTLMIIHGALTVGQLLFAGVTVIANNGKEMDPAQEQLSNMLLIMAVLLVSGGIALGSFLFKRRLKQIKDSNNLVDKLNEYSTALIIRFALMEAASLFCIVGYLLTSNYIFLCLAAIIVVMFLVLRPTKASVLRDMELG
ncbi:MAG: hypothetical protein ACKOXB_01160 [Flavobacteriales bacterium]